MHIENIDIEQIKLKYVTLFCNQVQDLTQKRKNMRIKQNEIAFYCKVSLRTIQNFEAYKCMDYQILFIYKEILNQKLC